MQGCTTHRLMKHAGAAVVEQRVDDGLPHGVDGAAIMDTKGRLIVLVAREAWLCPEHATMARRGS